ncbi:MAG: nucleotidyltransferase domain-containing protein [candidate division KSB1 bacterium]
MPRTFNTDILDQCLQRERLENEKTRKRTLRQLTQLLPKLAGDYGLREAYVFGSLTKPGRFRKNSDIDIAVLGLKKKDYFAFMAALRNALEREVDVIELESHPWREKILEAGIQWKEPN